MQTNYLLEKILPSQILYMNEVFSKQEGIIKLTLGEPDFNVPQKIKDAAIAAVENNHSHYTHAAGTPELRQAIADYLQRRQGLTYDPNRQIFVTVGATEALTASVTAMLNPGDKVLIPSPYFPFYEAIISMVGASVVTVDTAADGFILTPEKLHEAMKKEEGIKAVLLNFPSNPTGVSYSRQEVQDLAEAISQYDVVAISDEIYSELTYGSQHTSLAEFIPEQTILINGTSKAFAMTGYRVGFIAAPLHLAVPLFKAHQFMVTCATAIAQAAAVVAFNECDEEVQEMKTAYLKRRDYMQAALEEIGFSMTQPKGAFYLFVKVPEFLDLNDEEFCIELAEKAKVGTIPGSYFGPGGEGYFRLSYAASQENLEEAVKRMAAYLESKK